MSPPASLQTITIDGPIAGPAVVVDVPTTGMAGRGIALGDRILVEQVKAVRDIQPGHIVMFYHDDVPKIGEWQGSMVVFYPAVADAQFKAIKVSDIELYGRVRRLIREL